MDNDLRARIETRKREREIELQEHEVVKKEEKKVRLKELKELVKKTEHQKTLDPEILEMQANQDSKKEVQLEIANLEMELQPKWIKFLILISAIVFLIFGLVGIIGLFIDASKAFMPLAVAIGSLIFLLIISNHKSNET